MHYSNLQARLWRSLASIFLLCGLLTGCGENIVFNTPEQQAVFGRSDYIGLDISFVKVSPADATFTLNGVDVTSEFTIDAAASKATASLLATNILDEKNRLVVTTPAVSKTLTFFVDRTGPEFHVTGLDPWLMLPGVTVTFSGYVTDLSPLQKTGLYAPMVWQNTGAGSFSSVAPITINDNNEFTATVTLQQDPTKGVGEYIPLVFRAYDLHNQRSNDAFSAPINTPRMAKARVTAQAFQNVITPAAQTAVNSLNLEQLIRAGNPVVDSSWWIFSFKLDVTNFDVDSINLNILPTGDGGYHARIPLNVQNLDVSIWSRVIADLWPVDLGVGVPTGLHNADVAGEVLVRFRVDGNANANPVLVVDHIEPNLSIIGGDFDAIDFGFPVDVPGLGTLEGLIFEAIDGYLAEAIGEKVGEKAAEKINEQLALIPSDFNIGLRGKSLDFSLMEASVSSSAAGLEVGVDRAEVSIPSGQFDSSVPREPGYHTHDRMAAFPVFSDLTPNGQAYDVGLTLDWDILNKTVYEAHRTGMDKLSTTVAGSSIPKLGTKLKDYELQINVRPLAAPYLDLPLPRATPALASIQAKDVEISVQARNTTGTQGFLQLIRIVANARADVGLGLAANRVRVLIDTDPRIDIRSVDRQESALVMDEAFVQDLVDYAIPLVMPRLADAIHEIRLPAVAGYSANLLEADTQGNRFFRVFARIQPAGSGGVGGIGGIGGVGGIDGGLLDGTLF